MARSDVLVRLKADTAGYDANLAKARRQLDAFKKDNLTMGGIVKQLSGNMLSAVGGFASIAAAVGALTAAFKSNIETALNFEKSMSQLSSLTGKTGEDLNRLKEYAIELGSTTTLSASEVADAFRMIGSQQPQLLESSEALKAVTKNAITLSEAAGIELATAAQTLSTSINQMGGDSSNAERFINVLAAASQKGAGDIAWLGEAITKSGTTAKMVGTSYEQLVANLEQLAQAGFDASTAGTALRSIIVNLEKQNEDNLKPSVVGLTEAFANLEKKHLSVGEMANLVGKMFGAQATVLAENAAKARDMEEAITGTNTAEEQAKTNTDNLSGSLKSLSSAWEGFNLHLNSSNGLLRDGVDAVTDLVRGVDNLVQSANNIDFNFPELNGFVTWLKESWTWTTNLIPGVRALRAAMAGNDLAGGASVGNALGSVLGGQVKTVPTPPEIKTPGGGSVTPKKTGGRTTKIDPPAPAGSVAALNKELSDLRKKQDLATDTAGWLAQQSEIDKLTTKIKILKGQMPDPSKIQQSGGASISGLLNGNTPNIPDKIDLDTGYIDKLVEKQLQMKAASQMAAQAVTSIGDAFASIEDPSAKAAGTVMQAIASIALGFGQAVAQASSMGPWGWLAYLAAGTAALATTISTVHSLTGFENGGEIKGNSFSGDNIPIMANAGEVVLTRAMAGNVAAQLQGSGSNVHVTGELRGESIFLAVNRSLKRRGKGELVTWK